MSNLLADQLGWCITTQDYLTELTNELKYVADSYNRSVESLAQARYIAEYLPQIQALSQEFTDEVNSLIAYIQDDHQAYIQEQTNDLVNKINLKV